MGRLACTVNGEISKNPAARRRKGRRIGKEAYLGVSLAGPGTHPGPVRTQPASFTLEMTIENALAWIFRMACMCALFGTRASAVLFLGTPDPGHNIATSGDNHGWQYEGQFGGFLGTPVAPLYFLSAAHIGNQGNLVFHGEIYAVVAGYPDPTSDLYLWKVDHPFPDYAPMFTGSGGTEAGRELFVTGRGTQRGAARLLDGDLRGWDWGPSDGVQRWGRNLVADLLIYGSATYVHGLFDNPGIADESALSVGDSGGGLFVQEDGLWKLAAINYAVDDLYTSANDAGYIIPVLFDARGFYARQDDGTFVLITGDDPVPTGFYSTRVANRLAWIHDVTGVDPAVLPPESFAAWTTLYFAPDERADATVGGPAADPDGDGVSNLLEFAFNLDPRFAEPAVMTADTGLRGLPLIRLETVGADRRLTVEFVRRTAGSGAGLTYAVQFATDPAAADWQTGGMESVTAINARWERVKVTDSVSAAARRFARVAVTQN